MRYGRDDIQQRFDPATWQRGLAYFEQDRVSRLALSADGDLISGRVRGSRPYSTRVQVRGDARRFYTHCSCPVGRRCKHAVALLLAGLDARTDSPALDRDISDWVDDLFLRHQQHDPQARGEISFELSLPEHPEPHLAVQCLRHRRLGRSNAVSKPLSLSSRLNQESLPATERSLLHRLKVHADENPLVARLSDAGSGQLLDDLVRSKRCFWARDDRLLSRGPRRKASAHWAQMDDGSQELQLDAGRGIHVLPVDPLRYFDPAAAKIGKIDSDLNPAILPLLARAPRVAAHQIEEFTALLDQRGLKDVPRPRRRQARTLPAQPPQPRLELMHLDDLVEWHNGFVPDIHVARLQVMYHGHAFEIAGDGESTPTEATRQHEGELLNIPRDPVAEAALLDRLPDFHLIPVPGNPQVGPVLAASGGPQTWLRFLQSERPLLVAEGWQIEARESFELSVLDPESWELRARRRGNDWFDLSAGIRVGEERLELLPLLHRLLQAGELPAPGEEVPADGLAVELDDGRLLRLPAERVAELLDTLGLVLSRQAPGREGGLRVHRQDLVRIGQWQPGWQWQAPAGLRAFARDLSTPLSEPVLPVRFGGELRAYQKTGLAWLQRLAAFGLGGVLADDMGLGKTIQTLAHLAALQEKNPSPALIVAPTSVLGNWRAEARRFTPQLACLLWHGPGRRADALATTDLVVTSYATLMRDAELFAARRWGVVVIDEAQMIKNPGAKISQAVRRLEADQRLCLTGTPVENHLGELWSLFDFLAPGFLGDARGFNRLYRVPIERRGDEHRGELLRRRIAPFLLRRRKDEVARELPPKSVMLRTVTLGTRQADLYESLRASLQGHLQQAIASRGLGRSQMEILEALLKLRQACCDPRLLKLEEAPAPSAKLEAVLEMLPELIEDGRRILLFSQFTQMLDLIAGELKERAIDYLMLTGRSRQRETLIQRFQAGEVPLFLISLKAGGTGLNLTAADTVIHYDPWWNPAVENQATDRAHRIGQDKPVFVYKLLCADTVEERIQAMQDRKQALADQLQAGTGSGFSEQDLELLLRPLQ